MAYDYRQAVLSDLEGMIRERKEEILEAVGAETFEEADRDDLVKKIRNMAWIDDSVTGNGSGSYFFNSFKSEEALIGNNNLIAEALREFDDNTELGNYNNYSKLNGDYFDVTVRCYLLDVVMDEAIQNVIDSPEEQVAEGVSLAEDYENYFEGDYRHEINKAFADYVTENLEKIADELTDRGYTAEEVEDGLNELLFEKITEEELDLPYADDRDVMHHIEEVLTDSNLSYQDLTVSAYFSDYSVANIVNENYAETVAIEEKSDLPETIYEKLSELLEQREADKADVDLD